MPKTLTVDEISTRISSLFLKDPVLQAVGVRGELSELKKHTSGHVYFTLLGQESRISCALFKNYVSYVPEWPRNGDEVVAEGSVSVYAPRGGYQLLVRRLVPLGKGAADRARLELMSRLEAEGLFSPRLKRPLPSYPERVAVVTSPTGAALRDVAAVASKRLPSCELVVIPVAVQGYEAPAAIAEALGRIVHVSGADCAMLVRGGGSRDDLSPFDDERVVRAVRSSPVPLVTGVGHEIDETLADLAADMHAPTPSAAAERVFPDRRDVLRLLDHRIAAMRASLELDMSKTQRGVDSMLSRGARILEKVILSRDAALQLFSRRLAGATERSLSESRERLAACAASLDGLSPLKAFDRGFLLCEREGAPVFRAADLHSGDEVCLRFADGDANAQIHSSRTRGSAQKSDADFENEEGGVTCSPR